MTWDRLRQQLPKSYSAQDVELVRRAYELAEKAHADQKRKSGEPYIIHPLAVAGVLAELRLDAQTVAAALLHDVAEDTSVQIPDLAEEFVLPWRGNGLGYEAEEVMDCLVRGRTESDLVPLSSTLEVMRILDDVRAQIGVSY